MTLYEIDFSKKIRLSTWNLIYFILYSHANNRFHDTDNKEFFISPDIIKRQDWEYFEEEKPKIENRVLTFYRYTYFDLGRKEFTQSPWTTEHWPVSMFISSSRNLIEVETKKVAMAIPSKGGIEFKAAE